MTLDNGRPLLRVSLLASYSSFCLVQRWLLSSSSGPSDSNGYRILFTG